MMDNTKGVIFKDEKTHPSVKKGKNYFLGIGINDYTGGLAALYNAVRDVERVGQILKEKYDFDILHILTNKKATRSEILKQLVALQKSLSKDDSLLIYYSGHGHLAPEDGYWIPVNADVHDIHDYIPNAQLRGLIRAIPTRHTLLIADSCYSGSFFPESETKNMRGAADELEKYRSRWAFCSGRHDQKVSDGTAGTHSPFAEALITELERNNRPKVYIQELAIPVINRTAGKYRQTPKANLIFDCGDDGGQFVFTLKDNEAEEWRLLDKTSVLALEGFVKKYPLSSFGVEADKLIKELNHEAAWQRAKEGHKETTYLSYLRVYPNGGYAEEAKIAMHEIADEIRWQKAKRQNSVVAFWEYIEAFPNGKYVKEAKADIDAFELKYKKKKEEAERLEKEKIEKEQVERENQEQKRIEFEKNKEARESYIKENFDPLQMKSQQEPIKVTTNEKIKPNHFKDLFIPLKEFYTKNRLLIKIVILLLIIFLIVKDGFDFDFNNQKGTNSSTTPSVESPSKDSIAFSQVLRQNTIPSLNNFIINYPNSTYISDAKQVLSHLKTEFQKRLDNAEQQIKDFPDDAKKDLEEAQQIDSTNVVVQKMLNQLKK